MPKKIENRQKEIRLRKNVFPAIIITIVLWFLLIFVILTIPPENSFIILGFFLLSFLCLLFTGSLILGSSRRGVLLALAGVIFLFLRYIGIGNLLNLFLILAFVVILEIYLSST